MTGQDAPPSRPSPPPGDHPALSPGRSSGRRPVPDEVVTGLAAGTHATTRDAVARLGRSVTSQRIRDWCRRPGVDVDVVRHPDGVPVRVAAPGGWENVWLFEQLARAEEHTRTSGRGRPRGVSTSTGSGARN